jgi:acyl carrier protein
LPNTVFVSQAGATNEQSTYVATSVRRIVADWAGIPPVHIYPDTNLADLSKLEWDGANEAELELSIEEAFGLEIREALPTMKTIRDLVKYCSQSHQPLS